MPCLLLKGRSLVKTVCFRDVSYIGDPLNAVRIFNEKQVDELVIFDITATIENKEPDYDLIAKIAEECFMPLCYGGGIRTIDMIQKILNSGVEKIVVNSQTVKNPKFIRQAADQFGSQSIIVAIDVKKNQWGNYTVYSHGGRKNSKIDPVVHAQLMAEMGAGEIILTSIDREGTWAGYDYEITRRVAAAANIPVIASGGAGEVLHFYEAVQKGKASAVAIGSMAVYHDKGQGVLINFPDHDMLKAVLN